MAKAPIALVCAALALAALAPEAIAQSSPVAAPPAGEVAAHTLNPSSDTTSVTVAPDRSATAMADPQSAAEFGSPSAVDTPSSAMPHPGAWPTIRQSAKRPSWLKKAPPNDGKDKVSPPH